MEPEKQNLTQKLRGFYAALRFFAVAGAYVSLATFLIFVILDLMSIGASITYLNSSGIPSYIAPLAWVATLFLPPAFLLFFLVSSRRKEADRDMLIRYLLLISVYVLLQWVIYLITAAYPGYESASLDYFAGYPLLIDVLSSQLGFLIEFAISIFVPIAILAFLTSRLNGHKTALATQRDGAITILLIFVQTAIFGVLTLGSSYYAVNLVLFVIQAAFLDVVSAYIGFTRSFSMTIIVQGLSTLILASDFSSSFLVQGIGVGAEFFLIAWGFLGFYALLAIYVATRVKHNAGDSSTKGSAAGEIRKSRRLSTENLWIRSSCPSCGNTSFRVLPGMKLQCMSCKKEIDSNFEGPLNVTVEIRRSSERNSRP